MKLKRVVVTGLGALTPLGNNVSDYWNGLVAGKSGAAPITRFDASKFKTRFACEVKNFDPGTFLDRKEARKLDLFSQFGLAAAIEAVEDSGVVAHPSFNPDKVGVIWAAGIGGLRTFWDEATAFAKGDGTPRFNPFFIPKMIMEIGKIRVSLIRRRRARYCKPDDLFIGLAARRHGITGCGACPDHLNHFFGTPIFKSHQ